MLMEGMVKNNLLHTINHQTNVLLAIMKFKTKLKVIAEATQQEKDKAFKMAGLWIVKELEGLTEEGAFSERFLGVPAAEYFLKRAKLKLNDPNCKWKWKEGTQLSTLMINIIKSDMGHVLDKFRELGMPDVRAGSEFETEERGEDDWDDANHILEVDPDLKRNHFVVITEEEQQEELAKWESRRDAGYKIACVAAEGDPLLEKYVELAFSQPDYRTISKKMKMTKDEVLEIEDSVLEVTMVTIRENEQGDTLRVTTVTDRTRIRDRERVKDVQERVEVRSDTVYLERNDSVSVQRTTLSKGVGRSNSPLNSLKWIFWMVVAVALLVLGVKVTKMFSV